MAESNCVFCNVFPSLQSNLIQARKDTLIASSIRYAYICVCAYTAWFYRCLGTRWMAYKSVDFLCNGSNIFQLGLFALFYVENKDSIIVIIKVCRNNPPDQLLDFIQPFTWK